MKLGRTALLPGGLFWRTFFLISLLIMISLTTWVIALKASEVSPRATQVARHVASIVNVTKAALLYSAPQSRTQLLADLLRDESVHIHGIKSDDDLQPVNDTHFFQLLENELEKKLGPDTRVGSEVNGLAGLWVSFELKGEHYWLQIERSRIEGSGGIQWIFWSGAVFVLSLVGAGMIVGFVNQPLGRLSRAAQQLARGEKPPVLPSSNVREVQVLNESFNRMVDELAQVEQDRALILAGISHDLRTPLTRLSLEIEMAPLEEKTQHAMMNDIAQMDAIVGQFLDFARWEKNVAYYQSVNFSQLVEQAAHTAERQGLQVERHIQESLYVLASTTDLERLLNNLVENSRKYASQPPHTTRIELWLQKTENHVVLQILDNGPGVPEKDLERIKQPFSRGDAARGQTKGAGLGLAIVDRIVKRLEGQWSTANRPQGGFAVTVELPLPLSTALK